MLIQFALQVHPAISSRIFRGAWLHQGALAAAEAGEFDQADRLLETAAAAYRRAWAVEALARLRVHQRMIRLQARGAEAITAEAMLDVIRALNTLESLESLSAPHELRDARVVLGEWLQQVVGEGESLEAFAAGVDADPMDLRRAA